MIRGRLERKDQQVHFWACYAADGDGRIQPENMSEKRARVEFWENTNSDMLNRKDSAREAKKEQSQGSMGSQKAKGVSLMG